MELRKTRAAVVGCGGISQVHIQALSEMEDVCIAAACDIREDRLADAVARTGARGFASFERMLAEADIDSVHLCTPHYLHAPMAVAALQAGKGVLSEKPMATTLADARAMIAASEAPGAKPLGVIFQNRYNASVVRARALIASRELGEFLGARASVCWRREAPYYLDSGWRGGKVTEGAGSLINQAIHTLDLLSYLGGPIERVRGKVFTALLEGVIEVEDNAAAVALYRGGQRALIHTSNDYALDAPITLEMQFAACALRLEGPRLYRVEPNGDLELLERGDAPSLDGKAYWGSGHAAQIRDFYDALRAGESFWLDGRSAFPALSLVRAIIESSETDRWVALEGV